MPDLPALQPFAPEPPASARPLGVAASALTLGGTAARNLGRLLFRRRRRTAALVAEEYDRGAWARLRRGGWAEPGPEPTLALLDGRLCRLPRRDYWAFRMARLEAILTRAFDERRDPVEVGCGPGGNLFALAERGWGPLLGLELSENALAAGRERLAKAGPALAGRLDFRAFDLLDPAPEALAATAGRDLFTYYCLEQLPHDTARALETLLAARPRRVLHLEPSLELLRPFSLLDRATDLYVRSRDYSRDLLATLRGFERAGRLRILAAERLRYAPTPQNFPLLALWEPTGS